MRFKDVSYLNGVKRMSDQGCGDSSETSCHKVLNFTHSLLFGHRDVLGLLGLLFLLAVYDPLAGEPLNVLYCFGLVS